MYKIIATCLLVTEKHLHQWHLYLYYVHSDDLVMEPKEYRR